MRKGRFLTIKGSTQEDFISQQYSNIEVKKREKENFLKLGKRGRDKLDREVEQFIRFTLLFLFLQRERKRKQAFWHLMSQTLCH